MRAASRPGVIPSQPPVSGQLAGFCSPYARRHCPRPGPPHLFPEPGRPKLLAPPLPTLQGSPQGRGRRPSGKEAAEWPLQSILQPREGANPQAVLAVFGQVGGSEQSGASLSKREAPCHKDKVALPVALPGPASVLLSLWRVGQRERGPKSPQSWGLVRLGRTGRASTMGLPVTAEPCTSREGRCLHPPAPTTGMGWQVDKAGKGGRPAQVGHGVRESPGWRMGRGLRARGGQGLSTQELSSPRPAGRSPSRAVT